MTPDGRCLIYSGRAYQDMRFLDHSIWQYDLATGEKVEILSQEKRMFLGYFACDEAGVIYSATDCKQYGFGQIKNLYRYDFASGETRLLHNSQRNMGLSEVVSDGRRGELDQFCLYGENSMPAPHGAIKTTSLRCRLQGNSKKLPMRTGVSTLLPFRGRCAAGNRPFRAETPGTLSGEGRRVCSPDRFQ